MRKLTMLLIGLIAGVLGTAKMVLRGRSSEDQDEIDLAAIVTSRKIRMRARPFQGGTILVSAATVELDLRRVLPAPTGIEVAVLMIGGFLRLVVPPDWQVISDVETHAARVSSPPTSASDEAPALRVRGRAWFSRIEVIPRPVPVAVAS